MIHAWIDPFGDFCSHLPENSCAFLHTFKGNKAIDVACAKKDRCILEGARIGPARAWWTDQTACKKHDPTIAVGMSDRVFCRQTCALRETEQHHLSTRKAFCQQIVNKGIIDGERR